ncbi:MAG: hypothetical protein KBS81_05285, partial [Spirochaetales bacterium]|nr:hypothetical protein [Candidatus Physcosoma equi]
MKRLLVLSAILLLCTSVFASIRPEVIYYADRTSLQNMCSMRGLSTSGSDEDLRSALYDYEELDVYTVKESTGEKEEEQGKSSYQLEVLNADSLSEENGVLTLAGVVSISIKTNDQEPKNLSASRIVVDGELSKVTALGNVIYRDSDSNAALQEISADVFTILWEKGDIYISGGTTSTERQNVDNDTILFYTSGETLTYLDEGAILYDNGYITSNPKHAYSSISAKKLELLPGQDMFLSQATFNIGRVPVLYLPAFMFPGSRIIGNPNFGFSSTKGAFVNTTFEIFGSYPKFKEQDNSSSFTAILKSGDDESSSVINGYYYGEGEVSELEKWAVSNGSYLAVMADAYRGDGYYSSIIPDGG